MYSTCSCNIPVCIWITKQNLIHIKTNLKKVPHTQPKVDMLYKIDVELQSLKDTVLVGGVPHHNQSVSIQRWR